MCSAMKMKDEVITEMKSNDKASGGRRGQCKAFLTLFVKTVHEKRSNSLSRSEAILHCDGIFPTCVSSTAFLTKELHGEPNLST